MSQETELGIELPEDVELELPEDVELPDFSEDITAELSWKNPRHTWWVEGLDSNGRRVPDYPAHSRPIHPFKDSFLVLVEADKITPQERRRLWEDTQWQQETIGVKTPQIMVPPSVKKLRISRMARPRPGDIYGGTWTLEHLDWTEREIFLPEQWEPTQDLLETFPGYDWERLRGYELQPWKTLWAPPHEMFMEMGRRSEESPVEAMWRYIRILEWPKAFQADSIDCVRFMSLVVRLTEPDPWIGHRIWGRNLLPAAVVTSPSALHSVRPLGAGSIAGLAGRGAAQHLGATNGFRRPSSKKTTKTTKGTLAIRPFPTTKQRETES